MVIEGLKGRGMVTVFDLNSPHHCAKLVAKREPAMFQDTLKWTVITINHRYLFVLSKLKQTQLGNT